MEPMYVNVCVQILAHVACVCGVCVYMACFGMRLVSMSSLCLCGSLREVCIDKCKLLFSRLARLQGEYLSRLSEKQIFTHLCHFAGFFFTPTSDLKLLFTPYFDREGDLVLR